MGAEAGWRCSSAAGGQSGSHEFLSDACVCARLQVWLGTRYTGHVQTSEEYSTAGRSIKARVGPGAVR